eukprot:5644147-Lingulodinium_polyedra.AAC.1
MQSPPATPRALPTQNPKARPPTESRRAPAGWRTPCPCGTAYRCWAGKRAQPAETNQPSPTWPTQHPL